MKQTFFLGKKAQLKNSLKIYLKIYLKLTKIYASAFKGGELKWILIDHF